MPVHSRQGLARESSSAIKSRRHWRFQLSLNSRLAAICVIEWICRIIPTQRVEMVAAEQRAGRRAGDDMVGAIDGMVHRLRRHLQVHLPVVDLDNLTAGLRIRIRNVQMERVPQMRRLSSTVNTIGTLLLLVIASRATSA